MYVDSPDWRPPTLLAKQRVTPLAILMGIATAIGAHVLLPLAMIAIIVVGAALGLGQAEEPEQPAIQEREIVEARFVKLGRPPDPNKLPDRRVNRLSTAPPDHIAVSANPRDHDVPDAGRPPNPTQDMLTRLGDRAQLFAEIAEAREEEGSPDGIEEGTSTEARAGDIYAGRLYAFFRRGWTVPTLLSDAERQRLTTEVDISIGADLQIRDFRLRRTSGNPLFDQSVLDNLQQLKESSTPLPAPPPEIADQYLGQTIGLRFRGRDAG